MGEPSYHGLFHLDISGLFNFADYYDATDLEEQIPPIHYPGHIPSTGGYYTRMEDG